MPVTKSAKKALRVATRRHEENLMQRSLFKKTIKQVKKAVASGSDQVASLFSQVQSTLDRAAKNNTIHPNKAARLKSRLSKSLTVTAAQPPAKKTTRKTSTTKKSTKKTRA